MKITAENCRKMYKSMVAARENRERTYLTQVLTHLTFGRSGISYTNTHSRRYLINYSLCHADFIEGGQKPAAGLWMVSSQCGLWRNHHSMDLNTAHENMIPVNNNIAIPIPTPPISLACV